MKSKASEVGPMGMSMNNKPAKKYAGDMQHANKGSAGKLPQGGKLEAKRLAEEDAKEESAGIPSSVGAGHILHGMPPNHLSDQDPVHEAAGFVAPKTY